jgi:hypothetical protein
MTPSYAGFLLSEIDSSGRSAGKPKECLHANGPIAPGNPINRVDGQKRISLNGRLMVFPDVARYIQASTAFDAPG